MATASYTIENDAVFKRGLDRTMSEIQDLRIPFGLILQDFYKSERAIFQLKSAGKYPDFQGEKSPAGFTKYKWRKIKRYGFAYPLLKASGKLEKSITTPNSEGSIANISPLSLIFGTQIPYAIYHQSDAPRSKIPLRKFIFIGAEAPRFATSEQQGRLERWLNILNDYVLKTLARRK
jgi:phage gpG-like protein